MRSLMHRFYEWLMDRDASESKAKDQVKKLDKQQRRLKDQRKVEALKILLKSRIPGFVGYDVIDNKIVVLIEPEVGYGMNSGYLIFSDDPSKRVKVPSGLECDALAGIAVACKWSDVIFPIPGDARIFYDQKDRLPLFKRGDTFESLMIEAGLQGEDFSNG